MSKKISMRYAAEKICYLEPFQCYGALSGVKGSVSDVGRMEGTPWADVYREGAEFEAISYTVLSCGTPIAWYTADGWWIVPPLNHSTTTRTRHAPRVREALIHSAPIRTLDQLRREYRNITATRPATFNGEGAIYSPEYLRRKASAAMS